MKGFWFLAAALAALPLVAEEKADGKAADKKVKSGCQPGENLSPFQVVDVTGQFKESPSVCYI